MDGLPLERVHEKLLPIQLAKNLSMFCANADALQGCAGVLGKLDGYVRCGSKCEVAEPSSVVRFVTRHRQLG